MTNFFFLSFNIIFGTNPLEINLVIKKQQLKLYKRKRHNSQRNKERVKLCTNAFFYQMIRIRFLFRNVENSQVAKNKCWGGEGADEEKKQLLHPWRSCFNYVTISPEFQFWSVHYNNRSLARMCVHITSSIL